ncbi:MAG: hypothetical protein HYZ43_14330 [Flavobacteriia bacterium]|nr:hypothetical protein [Flavobacteriia bacterium]
MKSLLLFTLLFCSIGYSQSFSIHIDCLDTLSNGNYHYSINGDAQFTDSMVVLVELRSNDSLETVIYSGVKDFEHEENTTLSSFSVNSVEGTFSIDLIDLPTNQVFVFIRSSIMGEMKEEILIPAFISF